MNFLDALLHEKGLFEASKWSKRDMRTAATIQNLFELNLSPRVIFFGRVLVRGSVHVWEEKNLELYGM